VDDKLNTLSLAKLLLEHKAAPNAQLLKPVTARGVLDGADGTMGAGSTPFLRAARSSDLESMKLLLEHGADPKIATQDGADAVMLAAGISWRDGKTRAAEADSVAAIKMLVGMGLPVTGTTVRGGETALHGAAGRGADEVVQALVDLKADVNVKDKTSRTPLDVANAIGAAIGGVRAPHETTVALLTKLGGVTGQPPAQTASTLAAPLSPEIDPTVAVKIVRIPAEKSASASATSR
jgi:ankyrin repeat protein